MNSEIALAEALESLISALMWKLAGISVACFVLGVFFAALLFALNKRNTRHADE